MWSVRHATYKFDPDMTEHDKIEHRLPNGDILIVDSTRVDPSVKRAFDKVKSDLRQEARDAYRQLRESRVGA